MTAVVQQKSGEVLIRVLAFTLVISSVSAMIFNIVLPQISTEFALSYAQVSWVTAIYMLIYAIGSVIYGRLADSYKLKSLLTFGLVVFMLGSLVGLASHAYWMVLVGRVLQAIGASVIPATAMIIPIRYFPPETRGRALGISATGLAVGGALGPVIAALVVSVVHWRWLFCIPLFIVFILPYFRKHLDDHQGDRTRIDWLGGGLLAVTVALLLLAVTLGLWSFGLCSLIVGIGFGLRVRYAEHPFVPVALLKNKRYAVGLGLCVLVMGMGFSLPFLTPQLLAEVNQLEAGWIGFAMVPAAVVSALLARRVLYLISFLLLSVFVGIAPVFVALFLIFGTVGQLFIQISMSNAISRTLSKEQTGVGMGLFSMVGFLSGAVSTGIYSKAVDYGAATYWIPWNPYANAAVFSNIYLALIVMTALILVIFRYFFSKETVTNIHKG